MPFDSAIKTINDLLWEKRRKGVTRDDLDNDYLKARWDRLFCYNVCQLKEEVEGEGKKAVRELKRQAMIKIGRDTIAGLDSFVKQWKAEYGQDLPWVIRVPGLAWFPDLKLLDEWLLTFAGQKVKPKRKKRQ